ncbi:MAG: response regulator transcription factor [Christensenellaceae bacterium]|nr:response regulator transcription factor [Christensenellaceae bacterium]
MSAKQQVLICDDQHIIHETLGVYLKNDGFECISAFDGEQAMDEFNKRHPDIIILDLMMPKKNGMDVCREIRQSSNVPIIMLTAKSEEIDRVLGLELGADDYIVKPFSAREVVARVKAVLRRFTMQDTEPAQVLRYGNLEININNYDVRLNGERLPLTPKEVEIFQLLASHPGKVFSREKILSLVWGYEYYGDTRAVDTQIKRIRQKIQPEDAKGWAIKTVYGVGYRFEAYDDNDSFSAGGNDPKE